MVAQESKRTQQGSITCFANTSLGWSLVGKKGGCVLQTNIQQRGEFQAIVASLRRTKSTSVFCGK